MKGFDFLAADALFREAAVIHLSDHFRWQFERVRLPRPLPNEMWLVEEACAF
jgi:hypothetical protein